MGHVTVEATEDWVTNKLTIIVHTSRQQRPVVNAAHVTAAHVTAAAAYAVAAVAAAMDAWVTNKLTIIVHTPRIASGVR